MTGPGFYSAPPVSIQETVHDRMMESVAHAFLQRFTDLSYRCYLPYGRSLKKGSQEQDFFLSGHVLIVPPTGPWAEKTLETKAVVY